MGACPARGPQGGAGETLVVSFTPVNDAVPHDAQTNDALPPDAGDDRHAAVAAVAFDLDGTLYLGEQVVPGAPEVVEHVRALGLRPLFLTNTTMRNPAQLAARLAGLGIAAVADEIYSSATAAARYAAERGHRVAYVVGSPVLRAELEEHGLRLTERGDQADCLVVGFVPDFDPSTMPDGFRPECEFVAANLDADYPVEGGVRMPGCLQTVERVAARLGRSYDAVAGKPGTFMLECVEADLGLTPDEVVVVGDNLDSDVAMARAAGCRSILIEVHGGEGDARTRAEERRESGEGGRPDATVTSLTDVPAALARLSL